MFDFRLAEFVLMGVLFMVGMHEEKQHGRLSFPYAIYTCRIPEVLKSFPLHWHDEMEIIYISEGSMVVSVQNSETILKEGEMIFIRPQLIHSIRPDGDNKALYYNILFRFNLLENNTKTYCAEKYLYPLYSGELFSPEHIALDHELCPILTPHIKTLVENKHYEGKGEELLIKSELFAIMYHLYKYSRPGDEQDIYRLKLSDKLKTAISFAEEHYNENISVSQAAELCNFSESHFSKMFRSLTGTSFIQYLKNYRLEMAAEKLSSENKNVSETAIECGFNNISYFTRAFFHKYGVTPSQYISSYKKINLNIR